MVSMVSGFSPDDDDDDDNNMILPPFFFCLPEQLSVAWFKYWLEWPTIGVYKIASMMTLTALLGGDIKGLPDRFRKKFLLTWLRSLQVWPIYDTVLYAYVPASHRPLFNTFMSILWGGYLSHISQAEQPAAAIDHHHNHHHHGEDVHHHHHHDGHHDHHDGHHHMPDVPLPEDGAPNEFWEEVEGAEMGGEFFDGDQGHCVGGECEAGGEYESLVEEGEDFLKDEEEEAAVAA